MPYRTALGDVIEVKQACFFANQLALNVLHYVVTAVAGTGATETDIATDGVGWGSAAYPNLIGDNAVYFGAHAQAINPAGSVGVGIAVVPPIAGVGGANILPSQVCGLVSEKTDFRGRAFRGRLYIPFPGINTEDVTEHPTAAYLLALGGFATALLAGRLVGGGPNTATLSLAIWHRAARSTTLVTSTAVRQGWATQRRRGDFGRLNVAPW
jgi:hypothetical protein